MHGKRIQWLRVQSGATAFVCAKASAVLPTSAFVSSVQMSFQLKRGNEILVIIIKITLTSENLWKDLWYTQCSEDRTSSAPVQPVLTKALILFLLAGMEPLPHLFIIVDMMPGFMTNLRDPSLTS